jgi:hypothetical protein
MWKSMCSCIGDAMTTKSAAKSHKWGPMKEHSFKDGTYQTCRVCGAIRFKGDRYAYGRVPCLNRLVRK